MAKSKPNPVSETEEAKPIVGIIEIRFADHSTEILGQRFDNIDMGQLIIAERVLKDMVNQQFVQARIAQMTKENIPQQHQPSPILPVRRTLREIGKINN